MTGFLVPGSSCVILLDFPASASPRSTSDDAAFTVPQTWQVSLSAELTSIQLHLKRRFDTNKKTLFIPDVSLYKKDKRKKQHSNPVRTRQIRKRNYCYYILVIISASSIIKHHILPCPHFVVLCWFVSAFSRSQGVCSCPVNI